MKKQSKLQQVNEAITELSGVLQLLSAEHLAILASGKVNLEALMADELANRGLNKKGEWVGFKGK